MLRQKLWKFQAKYAPYLFVAPFVILFLSFMVYPLVRSIVLSFCATAGPGQTRFVGLGNYAFLLKDSLFWLSVGNTLLYSAVFLSIQLPTALVLAILLNNKSVKFRNFFRFAFFSSHLVGGVFVAVLFSQILGTRSGMLNQLLGLFTDHVPQINWLGDPWLARASVLIAWLWLSLGYAMIYLLAALQSVDQELYEAASVDGANKLSQFWHVTIPGIRPVLTFMLLVGIIGSFQLFELPFVLLNGNGPQWSGLTIVSYLFSTAFSTGDLGYASAIGWALVLMLLVISILQLKLTGATKKA